MPFQLPLNQQQFSGNVETVSTATATKINDLVGSYLLMQQQQNQQQQFLLNSAISSGIIGSNLETLQRVAPFIAITLTGFYAIPIRLKIMFERILQDVPERLVQLLLAKYNWTLTGLYSNN